MVFLIDRIFLFGQIYFHFLNHSIQICQWHRKTLDFTQSLYKWFCFFWEHNINFSSKFYKLNFTYPCSKEWITLHKKSNMNFGRCLYCPFPIQDLRYDSLTKNSLPTLSKRKGLFLVCLLWGSQFCNPDI